MTETSGPSAPRIIHRGQVDAWLAGLSHTAASGGPTVEELQASLSWRITGPLRTLKLRERVRALRAGKLRLNTARIETPTDLGAARSALYARLRAVAPHLLPPVTRTAGSPAGDQDSLETLLAQLAHRAQTSESTDALWLLMIAVSGCFPDHAQLIALRRDLIGANPTEAVLRILGHCGVWTSRYRSQLRRIEVVTDQLVAVVDFTARFGFNSGVQRVTRETLKRWNAAGGVRLAAFTTDGVALRELAPSEAKRVVNWDQQMSLQRSRENDADFALVVPWKTQVFLPEVPHDISAQTLATLARHSPNSTSALVYDTIPSSSGHFVGRLESLRFVTYVSMIKYFDRVIAISRSAAEEFAGFTSALVTQGLPGPDVATVSLPIEHIPADASATDVAGDPPLVLTVGSNEPRKNQLAIVYAAERLWREGRSFRLMIVGGAGEPEFTSVADAAASLASRGRPIEIRRDVDETELSTAYRVARFTVFVSFHEGYGLPVAESIAVGTPVVATGYGSVAEIAEGGGCLTVDPARDEEIVDAMRQLLDDDVLERLTNEIAARNDPGWNEYAADVRALVEQTAHGTAAPATRYSPATNHSKVA